MKQSASLIINLFIVFKINLFSQHNGEPISFGEYRTLYSQIFKEEWTQLINLPEYYHHFNKHYPVIFQPDGNKGQYFRGISAIKRLTSENSIPENIYVATANTEHDREMYPFETDMANLIWEKIPTRRINKGEYYVH